MCKIHTGDSRGGPVAKTSPSNAEDASSNPGWGAEIQHASQNASSIPGWGAEIQHASRRKNQSMKRKQYCNKFTKDFKNGPH